MNIRAVLFDWGGVLRADEHGIFDTIDASLGAPVGTLWSAWHDIPEYFLSREGRIDRATFNAAMVKRLAETLGDAKAEQAVATVFDRLAALPPIDDDMRALLARLRASGRVRLGLLSNAPKGTTASLEARGLVPLFDDAIVSGDVGLAKPDPAIYRFAAERLGVEPVACLFIDDMPRNIEGARQAGMTGHLYAPGGFAGLVARLIECGALPRNL